MTDDNTIMSVQTAPWHKEKIKRKRLFSKPMLGVAKDLCFCKYQQQKKAEVKVIFLSLFHESLSLKQLSHFKLKNLPHCECMTKTQLVSLPKKPSCATQQQAAFK